MLLAASLASQPWVDLERTAHGAISIFVFLKGSSLIKHQVKPDFQRRRQLDLWVESLVDEAFLLSGVTVISVKT